MVHVEADVMSGGRGLQPIGAAGVPEDERHWAMAVHIAALLLALLTSWALGLAGVAAAGVIYLAKRDASAFVTEHAREALNFNLSMFLYGLLAGASVTVLVGVSFITLGVGLLITVPIALVLAAAALVFMAIWLVCSVIATVRACRGELYRYPLTLRLIR